MNTITPPPELVQQWFTDWDNTQNDNCYRDYESHIYVATRAAQWGADQQLEQDAKWLDSNALFSDHLTITPSGDALRQVMRPKPPSLKEQALAELAEWENVMDIAPDSPIRRALEQIND